LASLIPLVSQRLEIRAKGNIKYQWHRGCMHILVWHCCHFQIHPKPALAKVCDVCIALDLRIGIRFLDTEATHRFIIRNQCLVSGYNIMEQIQH
jgi:hypothetical protein